MGLRIIITSLILLLFSCDRKQNKPESYYYDLENANKGVVKLYADSSTKYLLDQFKLIYPAHYPEASLQPVYTTTRNVLNAIYLDSVRLVILNRNFTQHEMYLIQKKYDSKPIQHVFAYDAITFVSSRNSEIKTIDSLTLAERFQNENGRFVTTQADVHILSLLYKQLGNVQGNKDLIVIRNIAELKRYLDKNPDYIGILPFSVVSDQGNPEVRRIASEFNWLGIVNSHGVVYPSQSTIYTKEWPYILPYTVLYCNLATDKGKGFVKFLLSTQGARLILKTGLVPTKLPERLIQIKPE